MSKLLVATVLAVGSLAVTSPALAYVSVYSDLQERQEGDYMVLTALGSAEVDSCSSSTVTVDVYLFDPGGNIVASNAASDLCSASTFAEHWQHYNSFTVGEWEARTTGSADGEFNGCASIFQLFGAARFAYRLDYIHNASFARYVRCNPGTRCYAMDVAKAKIQPPQSTWPLYLHMKLVWVVSPQVCFGFDINDAPICVADT